MGVCRRVSLHYGFVIISKICYMEMVDLYTQIRSHLFCVDGVSLLCIGSIRSKENQAVMRRIIKEVKGLNPTFDGADIRGRAKCNNRSDNTDHSKYN